MKQSLSKTLVLNLFLFLTSCLIFSNCTSNNQEQKKQTLIVEKIPPKTESPKRKAPQASSTIESLPAQKPPLAPSKKTTAGKPAIESGAEKKTPPVIPKMALVMILALIAISAFIITRKSSAPVERSTPAEVQQITIEKTPSPETSSPLSDSQIIQPPLSVIEAPPLEEIPVIQIEPEMKPVIVKPKRKISPELIIQENLHAEGEAPELELP